MLLKIVIIIAIIAACVGLGAIAFFSYLMVTQPKVSPEKKIFIRKLLFAIILICTVIFCISVSSITVLCMI